MKDLIIEGTQVTPKINFNSTTGVLEISGNANSNDINSFYEKMAEWLDEYLTQPQPLTTVELQLEYINSVFNVLLISFLEKCKTLLAMDKKLHIKWHHHKEDEDSVADATRNAQVIDLSIELVEFE